MVSRNIKYCIECNRYNVLAKQNLKNLSKYYLVDLGFKKFDLEVDFAVKKENNTYT